MKICPKCNSKEEFFSGRNREFRITNSEDEERTPTVYVEICYSCGYENCYTD